jgi:hypothetical protein
MTMAESGERRGTGRVPNGSLKEPLKDLGLTKKQSHVYQ